MTSLIEGVKPELISFEKLDGIPKEIKEKKPQRSFCIEGDIVECREARQPEGGHPSQCIHVYPSKGRFLGTTPKQAALKAYTKIMKSVKIPDESHVLFTLREMTSSKRLTKKRDRGIFFTYECYREVVNKNVMRGLSKFSIRYTTRISSAKLPPNGRYS